MNFHHFIITRFNVNIYPIDFPDRLNDTWLSLRFELFQKYCFPTVQAQAEQDFTWLVLFDEQTPTHFRKFINIFSKYSNFVPLYCGEYSTIMPSVVQKMSEIAPVADFFVTTRLDNDDALSSKYVKCVHEVVAARSKDETTPDAYYINFTNGLQLHEGDFYDFKDLTNAFVTLVEPSQAPHTVFWVDHPAIHDVAPVIQAETQPLWLQVVHDMNVYNYLRGDKIDGSRFLSDFPCNFE